MARLCLALTRAGLFTGWGANLLAGGLTPGLTRWYAGALALLFARRGTSRLTLRLLFASSRGWSAGRLA
ncbi:MAG: hypothetical protein OK456_08265, partial [Thaumarchaeota archaeon]|nr:hypothetical protein [Nitrososphaerota archaeon]